MHNKAPSSTKKEIADDSIEIDEQPVASTSAIQASDAHVRAVEYTTAASARSKRESRLAQKLQGSSYLQSTAECLLI